MPPAARESAEKRGLSHLLPKVIHLNIFYLARPDRGSSVSVPQFTAG